MPASRLPQRRPSALLELPDRAALLKAHLDAPLKSIEEELRRPITVQYEVGLDTTQVSRVSEFEVALDRACRRATRFLLATPGNPFFPVSPRIGGLVFDSVEISSYRAKHTLHGQSLSVAQRAPILLNVLSLVFALPANVLQIRHLTSEERDYVTRAELEVDLVELRAQLEELRKSARNAGKLGEGRGHFLVEIAAEPGSPSRGEVTVTVSGDAVDQAAPAR
ncbi:MAG: hypothetical protein ABR520_06365 [Mycobacteriales bacterium]